MIFGDEKFLQDHDYDFSEGGGLHHPQSPFSQSKRLQYHETQNHPFMATNTSMFDRNPFKEFTTSKMQDLLNGKNFQEVVAMREEALKYHESL